jgi:hypothetical protein
MEVTCGEHFYERSVSLNTAFIEVLPTCDFNKKWLGLTSFIDLNLPS